MGRKLLTAVSLILNLVLILFLVSKTQTQDPILPKLKDENPKGKNILGEKESLGQESYLVTKVIDGDTIVLESGETLRYIGIDAPETFGKDQCFSDESTNKNKELVIGKHVRLEKDVSEKDRYSRLLRYVWLQSDSGQGEIFINEHLVAEGYAISAAYPPDVKYQNFFEDAEADARENNLGLWGKCVGSEIF